VGEVNGASGVTKIITPTGLITANLAQRSQMKVKLIIADGTLKLLKESTAWLVIMESVQFTT
jgi:hypothetical protein